MRDAATKRSRGFGFVTYSDGEAVDRCLAETHVIDGREVEAKRAIPREESANSSQSSQPPTKKVFLGGLSLDTTEEEIREVLEGMGKVTEVTIMREKDSDRPRGFGFAVFELAEDVDSVCSKRYVKIKDRDVEVKKAISQEEMRRVDTSSRARSGGQQGGYHGGRDHASSYGSRDSAYSSYGRGGSMYHGGVGAYDYRYGGGSGMEYMRPESYAYPYPAGTYDRNAAYAYSNTYGRGSYDMQAAYGMYGASMGVSAYGQTPSSYGPSRTTGYGAGVGTAADYGKDRNTSRQSYHPYRRAQ
jgi:RNA recognition motif-containing protein